MVEAFALAAPRLAFAGAAALLLIGAATASASSNVVKRILGLAVAGLGALLALAALGAPPAALLSGVVVLLATLALGAALTVRLQEAYGGVEAHAFDDIDEDSETQSVRAP